jgi:hypothetical protein
VGVRDEVVELLSHGDGGATWEKVITVGGFDHLDDICASSDADVWGAQNGDGVNGHIHWVGAPIGGAVEHVVATAPADARLHARRRELCGQPHRLGGGAQRRPA